MNQIGLLIIRILSFLPLWFLRFYALKIYILLNLFGYRKNVITNSLNKSFPNKSKQEKRRITKQFYSHFAQFLIEMIKMFCISKKSILKHIQFKNKALVQHYYNEKKDVILVLL